MNRIDSIFLPRREGTASYAEHNYEDLFGQDENRLNQDYKLYTNSIDQQKYCFRRERQQREKLRCFRETSMPLTVGHSASNNHEENECIWLKNWSSD